MAAKSKHSKSISPAEREIHITDKLGDILKLTRLDHGYTREQISERAGISVRYLIAIENEGQVPSVRVLCNLLRALGLSSDSIFYPDMSNPDPETDQLVRLIHQCDERDRKVVLAVVNSLIDRKECVTV